MAAYTMQLKEYIESFSYGENLSHSERIERGRKYLFDFDYPIFSEAYRKEFETHFIRNFYTREIGSETEGLFKFRLETWLQINMPYYNRLFESELIKYDPLINTEMDTTHNKKTDKQQDDSRKQLENIEAEGSGQTDSSQKTDSQASSTLSNDDFNRDIFSDTPDSRLTLTTKDGEGVLEYATNITEQNSNREEKSSSQGTTSTKADAKQTAKTEQDRTTTDNFQSDINQNEDFIQHSKGKIGILTYPEMIMRHRESFLRIEKQLFDEMERLFMLVY